MRIRNFIINEDDLAALESNLSLIYAEGVDVERFNDRADIKEAWAMTIKTLSDVRFNYGPPSEIHRLPADETGA